MNYCITCGDIIGDCLGVFCDSCIEEIINYYDDYERRNKGKSSEAIHADVWDESLSGNNGSQK